MSDIVKAAIRGTQNVNIDELLPRASYIPTRGEPIAELQLLLQAGVVGMQRRAGFIPPQLQETPQDPICMDGDVVCDNQIMDWLPTLLQTNNRHLLTILISKLHHSGQRLPDEWLPSILNLRDKNLRHLLSERSRWLAKLANQSQWRWATDNGIVRFAMPELDWRHQPGIWGQLIAFRRLRQKSPTLAREQLIEKWHELDINYQADFIYTLAYKLSMEDEPFLWSLFTQPVYTSDDANNAYVVAHLMSKLPYSRFVQDVVPNMLAGLVFICKDNHYDIEWNIKALKQQCSWFYPLMYDEKNVLSGQKLEQDFLTLIPLRFWYEQSALTAEALIKVAIRHELVMLAWLKRAVIDADIHMAYAILSCLVARNPNHQAYNNTNQSASYSFELTWLSYHLRHNAAPEELQALFNLLTWEQFIQIFEQWLQLTKVVSK